MSAIEEYKNILLTGVKLEKMGMTLNAQKLYTQYVILVSRYTGNDPLCNFYGLHNYSDFFVENYAEAINMAYTLERLNELVDIIANYRYSWNDKVNATNTNDQTLMDFFYWLTEKKRVEVKNSKGLITIRNGTYDIKVIEETLNLLKKGVSFDIKCNYKYSLYETISYILNGGIKVDSRRGELI